MTKKLPKRASSTSIQAKPSTMMQIPVREMEGVEALALGFRTEQISCEHGSVTSGAGLGSPWTIIEWKGRTFAIHATELMAAVVRSFNPEDAARIDGGTTHDGVGVQASQS